MLRLASFEPSLLYFNEWWKQLFGESEGKISGNFSTSVIYSTDLHSLGQYLQDGRRIFLRLYTLERPKLCCGASFRRKFGWLKYLEGKALTKISNKALRATITLMKLVELGNGT